MKRSRLILRFTKTNFIFIIFILSIIFFSTRGLAPVKEIQTPTPSLASQVAKPQKAHVARVIDGDTIEIEGGKKIRYIGIDTPETKHPQKGMECYGEEAYLKNKELVEGRDIEIEKDVSETDKFGRLLRYIYVDNIFVNEYLVKEGFASVSTFPPDIKYVDLFLKAQTEAREKNLGLWNKCRN